MVDNSNSKSNSKDKLFCINFTRWKQNHIRCFLSTYIENKQELQFITNANQAENKGYNSNSQLISWASKDQSEVAKIIKKWGGVSWYIEDGFIRSTGLGTDLIAPASLVLDKSGIYYDPSQPSDLESLLENKDFNDKEIARAEALRISLLQNELSKYNLGDSLNKEQVNAKENQKIILIPGQVEGDASIKKGCVDVKTNTDLIKAVRKSAPDAYLIYKPHPDVISGNRKGKVDDKIMENYCNQILLDTSITDCLAVVDEVHTMTSLVGFEALLRDLNVVCYGLPFYSGWGLTEDRHSIVRRTRKLQLSELVAGTLIDYPLYMNWQTNEFTSPEVVVNQIRAQIDRQGGKQKNRIAWPLRQYRKLRNIIKGVMNKHLD